MSTYAERERERRFVILVAGAVHCETADYDHMRHVVSLLRSDGRRDVRVINLSANQGNPTNV